MQCSKLFNLSKNPLLENLDVINLFDAEGSNQVQIELDSYFLIFVLLEYFRLPHQSL